MKLCVGLNFKISCQGTSPFNYVGPTYFGVGDRDCHCSLPSGGSFKRIWNWHYPGLYAGALNGVVPIERDIGFKVSHPINSLKIAQRSAIYGPYIKIMYTHMRYIMALHYFLVGHCWDFSYLDFK